MRYFFPVFISTVIIPVFAIGMMKALDMIKSFQLADKMERTGPFIVTGMFYLWLFKNLYTNNTYPDLFTYFTLGATITLFACFVINIVNKISVHAAGISGFAVMVLLVCIYYSSSNPAVSIGNILVPLPMILILTIIIAGLIGSSRLYLQAHTLAQVLWGYIVGMLSMAGAYLFIFSNAQ